jgi:MFS superfamily sulfate permease-like transporter
MSKRKVNLAERIKADAPAGLVVYLVALPLCLGIALASTGRPDLLFSGIIAGIIGGVIVGGISGSQVGVSGPAAGLVVIVLTALQTLGSFEALLLATVIAGVIQLIAGFLRAGIIGYYFPSSVIKGMLAAIGLTLIMKEIPHALGYDKDFMGDEELLQIKHNTFTDIWYALKFNSPGAIIICLVSLALLILFDQPFMKRIALFRYIPGALFVVAAGIILNLIYGYSAPVWQLEGEHLVQLPVAKSFNEFINFFKLPNFELLTNPKVYVVAFTIAIVASIETLLCVEATDKLDPLKRSTPTNRELKAQGIGNIVSGLIGGLPITQVIVRSSANINAGGQTKLSAIVHGFILLISAIFIPKVLNLIPLASLAAILLMVGYKLSTLSLYNKMYKLGIEQFLPFIVTIVAILATDLLKGIAIGMVVAIYFILRKNYINSFNRENRKEDNATVLKLSEEVTFLNKGRIQKTLYDLPEGSTVIIDGSKSENIDYDVLEIIQEFKTIGAKNNNVIVETVNIPEVQVTGGH